MRLSDTRARVVSALDADDLNDVQITEYNHVPAQGPANKGLWFRIEDVTAVFIDIKGSTQLNLTTQPRTAARAYSYFVRSMSRVANEFGGKYVDVQGDAIFALFSGEDSVYHALASVVTMKTFVAELLQKRLEKKQGTDWKLECAAGMDRSHVMVRRLGLRGTKENEVWAGRPVNIAAGLASLADAGQLVVSSRVFDRFEKANATRRRVILRSCGCSSGVTGAGFDAAEADTTELWKTINLEAGNKLGIDCAHVLSSNWCRVHGEEFCETILDGSTA